MIYENLPRTVSQGHYHYENIYSFISFVAHTINTKMEVCSDNVSVFMNSDVLYTKLISH